MAGQSATHGFTGGNVLLYQVGGERYASPLASVREVVELPERQDIVPHLEGRPIRVSSLGEILGVDETGPKSVARSVLVVDTTAFHEKEDDSPPNQEQAWLGFGVDRVEGMMSVDTVHRVPDAITELPEGAIVGAFVLRAEVGAGSTPSTEEAHEAQPRRAELRRWLVGEGITRETTTAEPATAGVTECEDLVLILDLALLPHATPVAQER